MQSPFCTNLTKWYPKQFWILFKSQVWYTGKTNVIFKQFRDREEFLEIANSLVLKYNQKVVSELPQGKSLSATHDPNDSAYEGTFLSLLI